MFLAHIRQSDFREQGVQEHLEEVAVLARRYGERVGLAALSELSGFLHDMGKFTQHFTSYLRKAVYENEVASQKIDHSTAGAKYLYENYYGQDLLQNLVVETCGMAILSHHSGMQNFVQPDLTPSDYIRRVTNQELPYYDEVRGNFESIPGNRERVSSLVEEAKEEMNVFLHTVKPLDDFFTYLALMQKLVFSCLIDADRTNTRYFEENEPIPVHNHESIFQLGYEHLMEAVREFQKNKKPINQLRSLMSEESDKAAEEPLPVRTMTIPTGGGKTYASLRYALKHAIRFNKKRIFYIVPYTTILEQNAKAVRDIIKQPEAVLEHHANVIDDQSLDDTYDFYDSLSHKKMQLGRDDWDYPIIFTTMVQFLDAFYQKGTRKGRRLHNLTDAVIVFDEVQTVPYQHQSLFKAAVNFLYQVGNSSILLCTATQPVVNKGESAVRPAGKAEIVPGLEEVVKAFERVTISSQVEREGWGAEGIADFAYGLLQECQSVLIILNTKTAVRNVYELLKENKEANVVHLSTSMCPAHRKEKLQEIRDRLGKEKIICVSTQLIEAGVDISFEAVIRSLAGLDSIAQAAGRCNRHAEREKGNVYIIRAKEENLTKLPEIRIGGEVTENYILSNPEFKDNLLSPQAIKSYFSHFLAQAEREIRVNPKGLDFKLYELLNGTIAMRQGPKTRSVSMFKTIERHFEAIDSPTTAVIVPYEKGKQLIADLNEDGYDIKKFNERLKQAQQYSVNLYQHELQELSREGLIQPLFDGAVYCLLAAAYDLSYGVSIKGKADFEDYSF